MLHPTILPGAVFLARDSEVLRKTDRKAVKVKINTLSALRCCRIKVLHRFYIALIVEFTRIIYN